MKPMNKVEKIISWLDALPKNYANKLCLDIVCYLDIPLGNDPSGKTALKEWMHSPGRQDGFAAAFIVSLMLDQAGREDILEDCLENVETSKDQTIKSASNAIIPNLTRWRDCYLSWKKLRKELFRWEYE